MGGDWNIAPRACDAHSSWQNPLFCSGPERDAFQKICNLGLRDVLAAHHPAPYTWWDYRTHAFQRGIGLRIDHWLVTANIHVEASHVDIKARHMPQTSDHAPLRISINAL